MAKKHQPASVAAIKAMFALTTEDGWERVSLAAVARRAELPLAELHEQFGNKGGLLESYLRSLDEAVLRGDPLSPEDSVRDRLFDVIMRRLEAMQPHKPAIRSMIESSRGDPWLWLCGGLRLARTAALLLEAAGVNSWGVAGRLKAKGLGAIYLATLRKWLDDDSADMAQTMAALDKSLRRAEYLVKVVRCGRSHEPASEQPGGGGSEVASA